MEQDGSRLYRKKMSIFWWAKKWSHIRFITRELTSVAVALIALEIVFLLLSVSKGQEAYQMLISIFSNPIMILYHVAVLVGLLFHSITWFDLAPKAMVIKIGNFKVPGFVIAGSNYAGWIAISLIIVWILTR